MTENQEFPNPHHQRNFSSDKIASQNSGFYKQIPEIQGFKHENPVPLLPPQKYSNSTFQSGNQIQNPYANESRNQHKNPYVNETDSGPKSANNSDINTSQNQIPAFQNHNPDHYRNVPMSANKFQNQPNSNQTSNPYMNQGNINQGYPNQTDLDVQPSPKGFNANRSNFPPNQTNNFPEILTNSSSGMHLPSNYPNQMHTNYPANDQIERKTPQLHANPNFVSQSTNSSGNDPNQSSNEQEMKYGYQGGNYHQPLVQTAPKNLSDPTLSNPYQSSSLKMTDQSHLIYPVSSSSSPAANQYQASKSSPVYSTLSVVLKCAECKQALNDGYSLEHSKCHKTICMKCWKKLTQNNKNCPQCKYGLTEDEIFYIKSVAKN